LPPPAPLGYATSSRRTQAFSEPRYLSISSAADAIVWKVTLGDIRCLDESRVEERRAGARPAPTAREDAESLVVVRV
jgi:hypothetical protein